MWSRQQFLHFCSDKFLCRYPLHFKDVVTSSSIWDWNFLFDNLPNTIVEKELVLSALSSGDGHDSIGWGSTSTQQFSVKSAHSMQDKNYANTGVKCKTL